MTCPAIAAGMYRCTRPHHAAQDFAAQYGVAWIHATAAAFGQQQHVQRRPPVPTELLALRAHLLRLL